MSDLVQRTFLWTRQLTSRIQRTILEEKPDLVSRGFKIVLCCVCLRGGRKYSLDVIRLECIHQLVDRCQKILACLS